MYGNANTRRQHRDKHAASKAVFPRQTISHCRPTCLGSLCWQSIFVTCGSGYTITSISTSRGVTKLASLCKSSCETSKVLRNLETISICLKEVETNRVKRGQSFVISTNVTTTKATFCCCPCLVERKAKAGLGEAVGASGGGLARRHASISSTFTHTCGGHRWRIHGIERWATLERREEEFGGFGFEPPNKKSRCSDACVERIAAGLAESAEVQQGCPGGAASIGIHMAAPQDSLYPCL